MNVTSQLAQRSIVIGTKSGCTQCQNHKPFGCDDCRKEIESELQPKIYIGSGEDVPEWSFV